MSDKLVVTGASGQLGKLVLHHLLDSLKVPAGRIIATTRTPDALAEFAARGIEVRAADFDDPASLDAAFAGVSRVLLISTASFSDRSVQHKAAIAAAQKAGATHVIYTSLPEPVDPSLAIVRDHAATEKALADSDLPGWTVLRNNWYFENLFWTIPDIAKSGKWFTATGDGATAYISRDDLARAAATVLASDSTGRTTLTLGGSKAYTTAELAELIGKAIGREIAVVQVSADDLAKGAEAHGVPAHLAGIIASGDVNVAAGRHAAITGDYKALTGLEPRPFEDWLAANKAALAG
ncbi:NAD(P)H dehydrogenase (quinone) [Pseudochelatococcus lubricantis]|uniref:NAD(P)H dehydrogenase (Quinone) n=1 Tax=Pseudochelatococcus lubricantis TaxID=1538102 RepID=A0ABX0V068_9HYPH|nr:SDR family oxidoreductase [Pseudochelatococcus lubricantis]NIJ57540.1 NAD(P)H dehydrogenase (quinone) [Pseudochelatococcus lubricantis]